MGFQGFTGGYKGLKGITEGCKGSQRVTEGFQKKLFPSLNVQRHFFFVHFEKTLKVEDILIFLTKMME